MRRISSRRILVTLLAAAGAASVTAAAFAHVRSRAALKITVGSGKVSVGHGQRRVLSAHFTVENVGNAMSSRVRARLELTAPGHTVVLEHYDSSGLKAGHHVGLSARVTLPETLSKRDWRIEACLLAGTRHPSAVGCRRLGGYDTLPAPAKPVVTTPAPISKVPAPTVATPTGTPPTAPTTPPPPQVPTAPLTGYTPDSPLFVADGRGQYAGHANVAGDGPDSYGGYYTSGYYVVVPPSYDATNQTPETLVVWMHGCYGTAHWDAQDLTAQFNADRPYIVVSLNGPEDGGGGTGPACWDTGDQRDVGQVLADVTDVERHLNIDRRRVIVAGYSSGGDLAWQTIFTHATLFAGILADNTNPVRDNTFGPNGIVTAMTGAGWKFPAVQLSHLQDDVYHVDRCGYGGSPACPSGDPSGSTDPDVGVAPQISAMNSAGFSVTLTQVSGHHYNPDEPDGCNDTTPSTCTGGDSYEIAHRLMNTVGTDGWEAPAS